MKNINTDFLYLAENIEDLNKSSLSSKVKSFTLSEVFYCEYSEVNDNYTNFVEENKIFEYGIADTDLSVFIKHMNDVEKNLEVFQNLQIKPILRINNIEMLINISGNNLFSNATQKDYCALYYSISKNDIQYRASNDLNELIQNDLIQNDLLNDYKLEYLFTNKEILNIFQKFNDIVLRRGINDIQINEMYIFNSRNSILDEIDYSDLGKYIDIKDIFFRRLAYLQDDFEEFTKEEKLDLLATIRSQVFKVKKKYNNKYAWGMCKDLEKILQRYSLGRIYPEMLSNIRNIHDFNYNELKKVEIYTNEILKEIDNKELNYQ